MSKIDENLITELNKVLEEGLSENTKKTVIKRLEDILCYIEDDIQYDMIERSRYNLSSFVVKMAENAVNSILEGNEKRLKYYLSCNEYNYTGRDRDHSVIHGTLFESGPFELRKKIVEAYPELLKNERIKDLESQVSSLVNQLNALERKRNEFS